MTESCRSATKYCDAYPGRNFYDSPTISPAESTSILSAAGCLPSPGMSMMLPATATTNPAPPLTMMSRTCTVKPEGRPTSLALSEREYCVLAMMTGVFPYPRASASAIFSRAVYEKVTPSPP